MTRYRREDLGGASGSANAGRQSAQLAWFARNVVIKALLLAHLGAVARKLGHDGETWPY